MADDRGGGFPERERPLGPIRSGPCVPFLNHGEANSEDH